MEIKLTPEESENLFYNAMCDGLGWISGYGLELESIQEEYSAAKKKLKGGNPDLGLCYEDIYMEILRSGGTLKVTDTEGDGEYNREITLKDVHERVQKTPLDHLQCAIEETGDAITADVILQTVFFEEIIFG